MWKQNNTPATPGTSSSPYPEPTMRTPSTPSSTSAEPSISRAPSAPTATAVNEQATIGKSLMVKGELTGSESLYIDGRVEGSINLPGNRVTIGRNGQVAAAITAREIVVLGKVRGNCHASDRVDIRAEGSLTGDVIAARISIEDGAFFKGGIDIRKAGTEATGAAAAAPKDNKPTVTEMPTLLDSKA